MGSREGQTEKKFEELGREIRSSGVLRNHEIDGCSMELSVPGWCTHPARHSRRWHDREGCHPSNATRIRTSRRSSRSTSSWRSCNLRRSCDVLRTLPSRTSTPKSTRILEHSGWEGSESAEETTASTRASSRRSTTIRSRLRTFEFEPFPCSRMLSRHSRRLAYEVPQFLVGDINAMRDALYRYEKPQNSHSYEIDGLAVPPNNMYAQEELGDLNMRPRG